MHAFAHASTGLELFSVEDKSAENRRSRCVKRDYQPLFAEAEFQGFWFAFPLRPRRWNGTYHGLNMLAHRFPADPRPARRDVNRGSGYIAALPSGIGEDPWTWMAPGATAPSGAAEHASKTACCCLRSTTVERRMPALPIKPHRTDRGSHSVSDKQASSRDVDPTEYPAAKIVFWLGCFYLSLLFSFLKIQRWIRFDRDRRRLSPIFH